MSGFYGFHYDDCCILGCHPVIWQECTHYAVLHDSEDLAAPIVRVDEDGGGKVLCTWCISTTLYVTSQQTAVFSESLFFHFLLSH